LGKPSREFFESALWADIPASETCMIGDDVVKDMQGAKAAGIGARILVRTGKYREGDETKGSDAVTTICDSLVEAIDYIRQKDD
jgi:ribonucleotide monophosphatase NagD (HAD superfamily)